jgi:membrane protease YdiL (CAAX protease family)
MSPLWKRRLAALLEVFGILVAGGYLGDRIGDLLASAHLISPTNPFTLLTVNISNSDLLVATRQMAILLLIQYVGYFALIIPLNWWHRRTGPASYGLTTAGRSWKSLLAIGFAAACLSEWPVLLHTVVDAIHPLGATVPWRQAFFDMSWHRWQFWLFAGVASYAVIPVVEELFFRGYCQRRLAEDWGDAAAVLGVACLFTVSHGQYLIANLYNVTMVVSVFALALGVGIVFAWTRSLIPGMLLHAISDVPMTPFWQGVLLVVFLIGTFLWWRGGINAIRQVFANTRIAACAILAITGTGWVLFENHFSAAIYIAVAMLAGAITLEAVDRKLS